MAVDPARIAGMLVCVLVGPLGPVDFRAPGLMRRFLVAVDQKVTDWE